MTAIHPSVWAAFLEVGLRNAGMPLEMASTPDRATAPEAKARAKMNNEIPPMNGPCSDWISLICSTALSVVGSNTGRVPRTFCTTAQPMKATRAMM